ncbi:hypothetical protein [Spirosoma endbachense]|uniref:Uncharacterized protein n=1 Tax=Spirosoma endbachense TaxID=2666025 RepID=A0A6P1VXY7_9BACT|nr:hypothetical protein [Spirosoma endbachense]QHV96569.1 hypothetical protein GJR95_16795 [Spirosoma endbachense]
MYSCRIQEDSSGIPAKSVAITIDEAKSWYETSSTARARVATKKQNQLAFWKYAQQGKLANGIDVVSVPLLYNSTAPVSVQSDENFTKKDSLYSLPSFDRAGYQIQQKLLISKDENGNLRSVTITIIPERNEQRKKQAVKKATFSGVVLLMNDAGDNYKIGWRYKIGKLTDTFSPPDQNANARLSSY